MTGIVVGVDGSDGAAAALRWAAREAGLHQWDLTAVLAWGFLSQHHRDLADVFDPEYSATHADNALRTYIEKALGPAGPTRVKRRTVCDLSARALLDAATGADLLVVGARGRGGFTSLLLGSVSQQCLHHTTRPIAIVRAVEQPNGTEDTVERIVVGVDGSQTSRAALDWAVREARLRQASVEAVIAWHLPNAGAFPYVGPAFDPAAFEAAARETLNQVVDGVDATGLPQPIERIVHLGDASSGIIATAKDADLIVVGSRGLGGFSGLLLGSVGHHVAHHAPCPVVIIPPGD